MKKFFFIIVFSILIYSRFVGLNWGLPYPMHPDERNMANAIQSLNCEIRNPEAERSSLQGCFNPHFFAYGQLPLYIGYLIVQVYHFIVGKVGLPIVFEGAVMSLRLISTVASIINVFVLVRIVEVLIAVTGPKSKVKSPKSYWELLMAFLIFTLSPYFIQFSHFGTTEALLMLFYSLIIYYSLQLFNILKWKTIFFLALFSGLAIATKVSAIIFVIVPFITIISNVVKSPSPSRVKKSKKLKIYSILCYGLRVMGHGVVFLLLIGFFSIIFSPHNLISFNEFIGSMNYESVVALGDARVFYTRQFEYALPILFQLIKIFPYVLGWPQYILSMLGFFLLSWRKKEINLLRLAFLIYFIPNAFLFAKWTRFMTPILPIMSIFAVLFLHTTVILRPRSQSRAGLMRNLYKFFWIPAFAGMTIMIILPGLAHLSIYQNLDVRFVASKWIYENVPEDSYILFETANVVDVPIPVPDSTKNTVEKSYKGVSFNFYDIDSNPLLQEQFYNNLEKADYIFVPSRRMFANHYCGSNFQFSSASWRTNFQKKRCQYLKNKYPLLNDYYEKLFSGELGFKKVAEFSSYPKISFFGKTLIEFPDERAEETWSVFDHPVIRIYKRV